ISSRALDYYIEYYANKIGADLNEIIDNLQKNEDSDEYIEGEEKDQVSIRYERDQRAKAKCIKAKGCKCAVCGFDFEKAYGEAGKGFIEVHHIIPVSKRGGSYILDPINDLVPLCSNCHSMVHRKRDIVMKIEDLQKICAYKFEK
ncbi:MAG: HNH endonuclease, partial [Aeriscardovia sp.]|nr:HNH endonuclease [Aeriscardovia sp.]